jgi:hypothetical protein
MAERIQRKRTKGWRMPPNTVYVGRGSKWGNPFSIKAYGRIKAVYKFQKALIKNNLPITIEDVKRELKGKNLACWCALDKPCHADVLLELANK